MEARVHRLQCFWLKGSVVTGEEVSENHLVYTLWPQKPRAKFLQNATVFPLLLNAEFTIRAGGFELKTMRTLPWTHLQGLWVGDVVIFTCPLKVLCWWSHAVLTLTSHWLLTTTIKLSQKVMPKAQRAEKRKTRLLKEIKGIAFLKGIAAHLLPFMLVF